MSWRCVTSELPDVDIVILVCVPCESDPVWIGYHDDAGKWRTPEGAVIPGVTHWMPLPKEPEVDKSHE